MVAHINGDEANGGPKNLGPTCRSCNAKVAHVMKRHGMGRRTRQYNPRGESAKTLAQWMAAVMSMKGESDQMPVDAAVQMIHATPPATGAGLRGRSGDSGGSAGRHRMKFRSESAQPAKRNSQSFLIGS